MRVICTLSGIEYRSEGFKFLSSNSQHPIFTLGIRDLLKLASPWASGKLDAVERRLLFCAALKATEFVEFKSPASPNDDIIQKNMEPLLRILAWKIDTLAAAIPLSKFSRIHINYPETSGCENVSIWIDAWNKQRDAYKDGYKTYFRQEDMTRKEEVLLKLIRSAHKKTQDYAGQLASWAMVAAKVPEEWREPWTKLFKLKDYAIYQEKTIFLEEMVEWMELHLAEYHGTTLGHHTLKHIREILRKNQNGYEKELGLSDTLYFLDDDDPTGKTSDVLTHNILRSAANAPTVQPIKSAYSSTVEYLKALASWRQAQTVQAARAAILAGREGEINLDDLSMPQLNTRSQELDASIAAEEDQYDMLDGITASGMKFKSLSDEV